MTQGKARSSSRAPAAGGAAKSPSRPTRNGKAAAGSKKPPATADLIILETQVFRGPNYWSYDPCIRMLVDLGSLEHWPSNTIPRFNEKLLKVLPI